MSGLIGRAGRGLVARWAAMLRAGLPAWLALVVLPAALIHLALGFATPVQLESSWLHGLAALVRPLQDLAVGLIIAGALQAVLLGVAWPPRRGTLLLGLALGLCSLVMALVHQGMLQLVLGLGMGGRSGLDGVAIAAEPAAWLRPVARLLQSEVLTGPVLGALAVVLAGMWQRPRDAGTRSPWPALTLGLLLLALAIIAAGEVMSLVLDNDPVNLLLLGIWPVLAASLIAAAGWPEQTNKEPARA